MQRKIFISVLIFSLSLCISIYAQDYSVVRGIVDLHSNISDGDYSLERITQLAKEKGIQVLIFCDSALRKWEYGFWPLRGLFKKTLQDNSVSRFGIGKYLGKISRDYGLVKALEIS